MLENFTQFLEDGQAWDMYVTGPAGSGKTTNLANSVTYCEANDIPYIVCAFTHKACGILKSVLGPEANVATLHSYLNKRPTLNTNATDKKHVNISTKVGETKPEPRVLFLDEYSMVGEKDYMDIREAQDNDYEAKPKLKVVWLGDAHQLPPIGEPQAVVPYGNYQVQLTKIYRNDNPLQQPLNSLISFMQGAKPHALDAVPGYFERGKNLIEAYNNAKTDDKVLLAYTNKAVEVWNSLLEDKTEPNIGDTVMSPQTQKVYTFLGWEENPAYIDRHYTDPLHLGSPYRTLENLIKAGLCKFAKLECEEGNEYQYAVIFGHYQYKITRDKLELDAVKSNRAIEEKHRGYKAAGWARVNWQHPLARKRAKAWRDCLSFKDCVICLDFTHAMTVHKSQGSTYNTVFIDSDDIGICANTNFEMYMKLMYVAISRASHKVETN